MKRRRRQPVESCHCLCNTENSSLHAPWCPIGPVTPAAIEASRNSGGCDTRRPDYSTWRLQKQPHDAEFLALLREFRGEKAEQEMQPTTFRDWREPCERCGQPTLVITVTQGDKVRQMDLCECQLSEEDRQRNRYVEAIWAQEDRRKAAREAEKHRQIDHAKDLERQAAECRSTMEAQFQRPGCVDKDQDRDYCANCPWKRKKGKDDDRRPSEKRPGKGKAGYK